MKIEILTVCDYATIYGNKLCIIGASETCHSDKPQSYLGCWLVYRLRFEIGEEGTHAMKIVIADADGIMVKTLETKVQALDRPDGGLIPNLGMLPLMGVLMPHFGEFSLTLFGDENPLASIPIYFLQRESSPK